MFRKLLAGSLFAGLGAGVLAALLQLWLTVPLILEGELYETGARTHFASADGGIHDHGGHGAGHERAAAPSAAQPQTAQIEAHERAHERAHEEGSGGLQRHVLTFSANLVTWVGFALLMSVAISASLQSGRVSRIDWRRGLVWGLCGFLAVNLAPAAGLPPELPGSSAAPLEARQIWWITTVILTAAGIALIASGKGWWPVALGLLLILLPHVVGAPHPHGYGGSTPPELAALFVGRALAVNAASWAFLGGLAGHFWRTSTSDTSSLV